MTFPVRRAVPANPLAGARLHAPRHPAGEQTIAAWRTARPHDASLIERLVRQPSAVWFSDPTADIRSEVDNQHGAAASAGAVPVLVAYAIPHRDATGGHSAGGASDGAAYRRWIEAFAAAIGPAPAVVILEPDSLAGCDALAADVQAERFELLSHAVEVLSRGRQTIVYLDGGHSGWQPAPVMTQRLRKAGVANARGVALNVANFRTTRAEVRYIAAIAGGLGGPLRCVIDTSRNGAGPAPGGEWCNPPGRALGVPPTATTGEAAVDAFLWIKRPGESDGPCRGGPAAGAWWPDYALSLAQNGSGLCQRVAVTGA